MKLIARTRLRGKHFGAWSGVSPDIIILASFLAPQESAARSPMGPLRSNAQRSLVGLGVSI